MSEIICRTDEVPNNEAREYDLGNESAIVVNRNGQFYAYLNDCPHAGWPLNIQPDHFFDSENRFLQCSNHMALFEVETGLCVAGPCSGDCLRKVCIHIDGNHILGEVPEAEDPES